MCIHIRTGVMEIYRYMYLSVNWKFFIKLWVRTSFMARCTRYNIMWSSLSVNCDCYGTQEKPMPVSKLTCGKFPVVRRGMTVQIQQICFGLWRAIWALFGTKVIWGWWCGFHLRRPSCKAKSNWLLPSYQYSHYWQQRCPRMPSLFRRCCKKCRTDTRTSEQHTRPREKQCTGDPTYTTTHSHRNKTVIVDHIKYIFIVLVLPTKSVFKH